MKQNHLPCKTCFLFIILLKADVYNSLGESSAAQGASRTAKVLNIVGLVFGLIMTAIGIIYMAVIVNAFSRRY